MRGFFADFRKSQSPFSSCTQRKLPEYGLSRVCSLENKKQNLEVFFFYTGFVNLIGLKKGTVP